MAGDYSIEELSAPEADELVWSITFTSGSMALVVGSSDEEVLLRVVTSDAICDIISVLALADEVVTGCDWSADKVGVSCDEPAELWLAGVVGGMVSSFWLIGEHFDVVVIMFEDAEVSVFAAFEIMCIVAEDVDLIPD